MEIKIKKEIVEVYQLELPYYVSDGICHWYQILSEDKVTQITCGEYVQPSISSVWVEHALSGQQVPSSREEFCEKMETVLWIFEGRKNENIH